MIGLIDPPPQMIQTRRKLLQIRHGRSHRFKIVAGFGQLIDMIRIPRHDIAVLRARYQKMLWFHPDIENVTRVTHLREDPLEIRTRTKWIGITINKQISGGGGTTPGDLIRITGRPPQSVYNGLEELRSNRLVKPRGKSYILTAAGQRLADSLRVASDQQPPWAD